MRSSIKLIIIDFNGVIVFGNYVVLAKWLAKKYHKKQKHIYNILYHKWFNLAAEGKITEKEFFENALKELGFPLSWRVARSQYMSAVKTNKPLIKYLIDLQKNGYKILILSKNVPSQFNEGVKISGIRKYFKNLINTYDLGLPKASRKTIKLVLKKFRVKPEEAVYVDDQDFNLVEAKKLGVKTIYYKSFRALQIKLNQILTKQKRTGKIG